MPKRINQSSISKITHHFKNLLATQELNKEAIYKALSNKYGMSEGTIRKIIKEVEPGLIKNYNRPSER